MTRLLALFLLIPCLSFADKIEYLDVDVVVLNEESEGAGTKIVPTLGVVPRGIFGRPIQALELPISGPGASKVMFPLFYIESVVDRFADTSESEEVTVEPATTRLSRVSTGGVVVEDKNYFIGGGFKHPLDSSDLVLLYVDQPCTISGNQLFGSDVFNINLKFKRSGLHWISIDLQGNVENISVNGKVIYELFYEAPPN